jgi:hypothetical protein
MESFPLLLRSGLTRAARDPIASAAFAPAPMSIAFGIPANRRSVRSRPKLHPAPAAMSSQRIHQLREEKTDGDFFVKFSESGKTQ